MRLIEQITHPACRIAIMSYNDKWIIEFEAGPYKQTYKVKHEDVTGLDEVKSYLTPSFIDTVLDRFRAMHGDFRKSIQNQ